MQSPTGVVFCIGSRLWRHYKECREVHRCRTITATTPWPTTHIDNNLHKDVFFSLSLRLDVHSYLKRLIGAIAYLKVFSDILL